MLFFSYEMEEAGLYAARAAVNLVDAVAKNTSYDIQEVISKLKE